MKRLMKTWQSNKLQRGMAGLGILGLLFLAIPSASFACHRGVPHGKETDCVAPPPAGDVTLQITYEFGELTGGLCTGSVCASTTITATGTVECGNNSCDFTSTSVDDFFQLPEGLRDLLFATNWRGTDLNPDECFGFDSSKEVISGTAHIKDGQILYLARYNDEATPWFASVGTWAMDTEGLEERKHIFNFEGCGPDSCGAFEPGSMEGVYEGGKLKRIDGTGNDRKYLSIPCRCTISNTPDCPNDVPVPTPSMRIIVENVTP